MSIKKKQPGKAPTYTERWQVLATDPKRLEEARRDYQYANPKVAVVDAHRTVKAFAAKHRKTYGG